MNAALQIQAPGALGSWTTLVGHVAATDSVSIRVIRSDVFADGTWYTSVVSRDGSHGVTPGSAIAASQPLGSQDLAVDIANRAWAAVRAGVAPADALTAAASAAIAALHA